VVSALKPRKPGICVERSATLIRYRYESESAPGTFYDTRLLAQGDLCECWGFRKWQKCWHLEDAWAQERARGNGNAGTATPAPADAMSTGPGMADRDVPPPEPPTPRASTSPVVGTIPRNVVEDETSVLSAILTSHVVPAAVRARLHPNVFQRESHRLIYGAMLALAARGEPIDPHTLRAALDGNLDRAGGMEYLATLIDVVPTADHIDAHVSLILEHHRRRTITQLGAELAGDKLSPAQMRDAIAKLQELAVDEQTRARFRLLSVSELLALPAPAWLLERYLPIGGLSVLYGAPGSGKSFVALAWALSVAAGQPWIDSQTVQGRVIYVAAEGSSGLGKRIAAYTDSRALTPDGIQFIREPVNLGEPRDVDALVAGAAAAQPALVVIDTLSRCMESLDENSPEDMGRVIAGVDRIRRATGAHVVLVHHAGWSTNERPRGHSSLVCAADAVFLLKNDTGVLTLEFSKPHKDAPPIEPLQLRLVPIGESCVVEPQDSLTAISELEKSDRLALEALNAIAVGDGATKSEWLSAATERKGKTSHMGRATFYRCLKRLCDRKLVACETNGKQAERYSLTGKGISACAVS